MSTSPYSPILSLTRGETVEFIHYGAIAVVNPQNELVASYGDPETITFLRSSAKPFQAMPFVMHGGVETLPPDPRRTVADLRFPFGHR